jgi:hypothetical protein
MILVGAYRDPGGIYPYLFFAFLAAMPFLRVHWLRGDPAN